jgi:lysophospholipase L1-like esterase
MTEPRYYTAMGSSFGAGPGLRPRVPASPRLAGRSIINYAHLLATRLHLELTDVTFSGASIGDILRERDRPRDPQLSYVVERTALVTITCGGNDVGYGLGLTLPSMPRPLGWALDARGRLKSFTHPGNLDDRFRRLDEDLASLIVSVRERAPHARIVIVGYLTILPPVGVPTDPLPAPVAEWGREVAQRLSTTMCAAATRAGAEFLDVAQHSLEHHAWSAEPWTNPFHFTFRGGAAYHPTAAGMRAVAAMLEAHLEATGWPAS